MRGGGDTKKKWHNGRHDAVNEIAFDPSQQWFGAAEFPRSLSEAAAVGQSRKRNGLWQLDGISDLRIWLRTVQHPGEGEGLAVGCKNSAVLKMTDE